MAATDPIDIGTEQLRIRVLPQGAALVGVRCGAQARNLVLGFQHPAAHQDVPIYAGAVVGPVANRVRDGKLVIDGAAHHMPLNEGGRTSLHSGDAGLHTRLWRVTAVGQSHVTLGCTLPDGDCGLPGNRRFLVHYAVEDNCLTVVLGAQTDQTTPINLALHPYWNLDGHADLSGHSLHIMADTYLPTDNDNLPLATPAPMAGTAFDFRAPAPVPLIPELDVNFCLADSPSQAPRPAAVLRGGDGTTLEIATTAPGLQVYNGGFLPANAPATQDFPAVAPYAGIALEPQHWPDAPNHPQFPSVMVVPGQQLRQETRYLLKDS